MICLTGDVHHISQPSKCAKDLSPNKTEVTLARTYLEIAKSYGLKVTLFLTGRVLGEEWDTIKDILEYDNLEVGGHSFNALKPRLLHFGFKCLFGTPWGPAFYQKRSVKRTVDIIKDRAGIDILSWRNHALINDKNTYEILIKFGIRIISDDVDESQLYPKVIYPNLISLPINTMRDHSFIYHSFRTPDYVSKKGLIGYSVEEWEKIVENQIQRIVEQEGIATILAHPICMYQSNKFKSFEKLCKFISQFQTIFAKDVLNLT